MDSHAGMIPELPPDRPDESRRFRLKAGPAVVILAAFFGLQVLIGMMVGFVFGIITAIQKHTLHTPEAVNELKDMILAPAAVLGLLVAGCIILLISRYWFREEIHDPGPFGGAWAFGSAKPVFGGLFCGAATAVIYLLLTNTVSQPDTPMGPLSKMAMTPGIQQILWTILAVLIAPPIEELIFRGVVYGGLRRSWGPVWAAFVSTGVFVLLHITEWIHFWPPAAAIAAMSLVALWFRLRGRSIVPAIAVHFSYNSVLAAVVIFSTI